MIRQLKKLLVRWLWRYRSSQSGRFVSKPYADRHPDVTQAEKIANKR